MKILSTNDYWMWIVVFFPHILLCLRGLAQYTPFFLKIYRTLNIYLQVSSLVLKTIWSMMNHIEVSFVGGHLVDLWLISKPKLILVDDEVVKNIYFNIFSIVNWMKLGSKIITFCNRGWPLLGYQCNLSWKGNEFVLCSLFDFECSLFDFELCYTMIFMGCKSNLSDVPPFM